MSKPILTKLEVNEVYGEWLTRTDDPSHLDFGDMVAKAQLAKLTLDKGLSDDELREQIKTALKPLEIFQVDTDVYTEKLHSLMQVREAEAKKEERDRVIGLLKRATGYKLMQRMKSGRYFETTVHNRDWERFEAALSLEEALKEE